MRFLSSLVGSLIGLSCLLPRAVVAKNDGLTKSVTWDSNSLTVDGKRVFLFCGEFHYFRVPVPELWLDIFQKFKAEGQNCASVYFDWAMHESSKGNFDFETSAKNLQKLFDYAKQAGIYIVARPGPYINGETNGGGLALWLSDGSGGNLRTGDPTYMSTWLPYITYVGQIIAANEYAKGGPVILNQVENELQELPYPHVGNNTLVIYMEQLEAAFRAAGITIPFSSNEKGMRSQSWSTDFDNVGGAVNVYGLDSYPGVILTLSSEIPQPTTRAHQWFQNYSYTQPKYLPEFEGGNIEGWGGSWFDNCIGELATSFPSVYYKNVIGQQITMLSIYMTYGGTNWGESAAPVVYTSYDYSAPLRETRQIRDKFFEMKLIGLMTRVSTDLLHTTMIGNGEGYATNNSAIYAWELRNIGTNAAFYNVLQTKSSSQASVTFSLNAMTSKGLVTIPNINLNGRQGKILVTDYALGSHTLLYSSAEVLTYGTFPNDVLILYLDVGQAGQFAFRNNAARTKFTSYGLPSDFAANSDKSAYTWTQGNGTTAIEFSDGTLFFLMDRFSAYKFHAPATTTDPNVSPEQQIFVWGPYLVRSATISGGQVAVTGDANVTTSIEVYVGDAEVTSISWNGQTVGMTKTAYGSFVGTVGGAENRTISLPALTTWKTNNTLPEANPAYDDSNWTVCNKTTTRSPQAPLTLPVLFSSDYGFYTGIKIYRGRFTGMNVTAGNITVQNGLGSGWSAWINGNLVAFVPGNATLSATTQAFSIPRAILTSGTNVLTVVTDYHGHDETSTSHGVENPRGMLGASLTGGQFTEWRIQGNAGGSSNIEPVRGPLNEGGLYGERVGWHLPGFDASSWADGSPVTGLNQSGIQWYLTNFTLDFDADLDVPVGVAFSVGNSTVPLRLHMWINGYKYAHYIPQLGPQTVFPLQPGVLNNRGQNTLALSLWAQSDAGASLSSVNLASYGAYVSGFDFNQDWSYLQPGWDASRLAYA